MAAASSKIARLTSAGLALSLMACGGGDTPVAPPVATSVAANSSSSITAVAGAPVNELPSVVVRDQRAAAMAGVQVSFAVTTGAGSVTGGLQITNSAGVATVGGWTLADISGSNTLTATAGSLPAVTFTATGIVGPAANMGKVDGDNQLVPAGTAVPIPPSVVVADAKRNVVAGAVVTFTVVTGGGSVAGGTATTNSSGIATVGGWTLGPSTGANTLTASTPGAPSVTFTATATATGDCAARTSHVIGTTTNASLSTSDCLLKDGSYVDTFTTSVTAPNAYLFTQASASFNPYLALLAMDGTEVAENDDASPGNVNSAIKVFLPSNDYLLTAGSFAAGATGSYALSSTTTSAPVTNCEDVFIVRGLIVNENVTTSDCVDDSGLSYEDSYYIFLQGGQPLTLSMSSTVVDSYLELYSPSGALAAFNDDRDGTTLDARISYTASVSGYYRFFTGTAAPSQTGSYSLSVQ